MTQVAEAIYEDGVLRPLCDLELSEGERVTLTVKREEKPRPRLTPEEYIALFTRVYEGLSEAEIDEIESTFKRPLDMFADVD